MHFDVAFPMDDLDMGIPFRPGDIDLSDLINVELSGSASFTTIS